MEQNTAKKIAPPEQKILLSEATISQKDTGKEVAHRRVWIERFIIATVVAGAAIAAYYFLVLNKQIYTDSAEISAPLIALSPNAPAVLKQLLVKTGDIVDANSPVARIGNDYLMSRTSGIVVGVADEIGTIFSPGTPVVTIVNPDNLRVTAEVDEDKGFSDVRVGERAEFTVDAFGSKKYEGVVDEISKTSKQSSVVFSISDKREVKQFTVKIKYDVNRYPELLNGMSARVWIYKE